MKLQKSESLQNATDRVRAICLPADGNWKLNTFFFHGKMKYKSIFIDDIDTFHGVRCIATGMYNHL